MAISESLNPFRSEDIELAKAIVQSSDKALDLAAKCTDCGANVAALVNQIRSQREFALGILRNFGSPQPAG